MSNVVRNRGWNSSRGISSSSSSCSSVEVAVGAIADGSCNSSSR